MKDYSHHWQDIAHVNNLKFEFKLLNGGIPLIIANDYWKYPDKIDEFFSNGYWWQNNSTNNIRPGKSFHLHAEILEWFTQPIKRSLTPLFGIRDFTTECTFGNCFNGDMQLHSIESAFPHVDLSSELSINEDCHIACNINITETDTPIRTGFWSFNNLKSTLDFSHNDRAKYGKFFVDMGTDALTDNATWFQIKDYGPWVLEDTVDMVYNSMVWYPTHFFHNPYIEEGWFRDTDRITISSFLNTSPENLDFAQKDLDNISYAWEFFHLDKIHNYHPKKTIVPS